ERKSNADQERTHSPTTKLGPPAPPAPPRSESPSRFQPCMRSSCPSTSPTSALPQPPPWKVARRMRNRPQQQRFEFPVPGYRFHLHHFNRSIWSTLIVARTP